MEEKKTKKQIIMDVALDLFSEKGYAAVGVDEIGAVAGVKGPAIYHYFKGKEAILNELLNTYKKYYGSRFGNANGHLEIPNTLDEFTAPVTTLIALIDCEPDKEEMAMNGAASGHFLENYVVSEMIRNASYGEMEMNLNYYRDKNPKEIDLIVESAGVLHPFEIKRSASPDRKAIKAFGELKKCDIGVGSGGIICMAENPFPIDADNSLIPVNVI